MSGPASVLDLRDAPQFADALMELAPGYVPEWQRRERGAEVALVQIVARYLQAVARRLEQAPAKNELAFLELLDVRLIPAQPARAPLVVVLAENAADVRMPTGTRVAAAPPPGSSSQITYETERSTGIAAAKLTDVLSLWPGRDQYIDHSADLVAGQPFTAFQARALLNTPHALYIAHDRLLALAGQSAVTVAFELTTPSSDGLDIRWEYWDGKVWRPFKDMRPACSNDQANQLDSTNGLRASGAYRLEADCAQTAETTVADTEAFWIRGRLEETLPADPARVLPEVESIRLSTEITRSYTAIWSVAKRAATSSSATVDKVTVRVLDAGGVPLPGIGVAVLETSDSDKTDSDGVVGLDVLVKAPNTVVVSFGDFDQHEVVTPPGDVAVELVFTLDMAALDLAASDGAAVDVTKPFFPLGAQPQPGSAFYFSHATAFAKPGAQLRVYVQHGTTAQDATPSVNGDTQLAHVLSWEYWNGRSWGSLLTATFDPKDVNADNHSESPATLRTAGLVDLSVPADLAATTVNGQEALWMRVQLVSGGYGFTRTVPADAAAGTAQVSFFVPQPPSLADFRLGYAWQDGPHAPEHVLAANDFQHEDRTANATWPGSPFQPFAPVGDSTPALYLGFDRKLPVDDLGIFFDVVEAPGDIDGPTLVWEYSDGLAWQRLTVDDETHDLRVPGIASFIGPEDMGPLARFGTPRHWLRARLNEDGPPGEPTFAAILPNAVWVTQRDTIVDEPIGASTGQADQVLAFRQVPVLPGQRIEVRELAGPRANVEWRLLAVELLGGDPRVLQGLETELAAEGTLDDLQRGPLRLRRDRLKRVTEAWVQWEERISLFSSGPDDRHYALDRARGRLIFGDGVDGRVPPLGAPIAARSYMTGGGRAGNVPARAISQLLGAVGGVQSVFNARAAEGGADAESSEQVAVRGPRSIRHRGRALLAGDYETMAREASPSVAVARALPARDPGGLATPGWVTLVIIPQSAEPRPYPSFGLRESVRAYIAQRAAADLVAADHIFVTGPDYQAVDIEGVIAPVDPSQAGAVERAVHDALTTFLDPLRGGPGGQGWTPGEEVFVSDVAAVVEHVEGVDRSLELALLRNGVAAGASLAIGPGRLPVAGDIRLRLVEG
jgi:uncharacterized phage protein gp47/JayE